MASGPRTHSFVESGLLSLSVCLVGLQNKKNSAAFGLRTNYTDRETADYERR
jgi:hypothetical protein